jgi:hypothetical protein
VLDQPGIGSGTNAPQQDEVKVVLISDDLEVIPRHNPPAGPNGFGDHKLAALAQVSCHWV